MKKWITLSIAFIILFDMTLLGGQDTVGKQDSEAVLKDVETAVLGGGCFWCIEAIFENLKGVEKVESGYAGGHAENPTYQQVCTGNTGHAEVVRIVFNPGIISYEDILRIFFDVHDPTTLNRQGADVGTQYRSIILTLNENQKQMAEKVIQEIENEKIWENPIVTEVVPFTTFHMAEDYHQEYYENNPNQSYCRLVISPKVGKFRKAYKEKLDK